MEMENLWYSYRPVHTVAAARANRYLKHNASKAGHHRVASCCPVGCRHSHPAGAADLLNVEFDVDGRASCVRDLSLAGDYHVAGRNVCLPSHSASAKVAGGIDYYHVVPAFARVVFCCLIVVRAQGNATTACDTSQ